MRVIVAPDKFKGSLDATAVADAVAEGFHRSRPEARVTCAPMADGGEGTLDALFRAQRGQRQEFSVHGPLGTPCTAAIGLFDRSRHVVIELAQAAGYSLVPPDRRDPLMTTTLGVGELLARALDFGPDRITLTLGGSATVDGGAGLMQGLGLDLIDRTGRVMPPGLGGGALCDVARFGFDGLHPALHQTPLEIAADVLNPLCGPNGAARVFAPQKGADAAGVGRLEQGLAHWAELWENGSASPLRLRDQPGTGAAGGAALPLLALTAVMIQPGVDLVIDAVGLRDAVVDADLVITGEGRLDGQSGMGKVVHGILRLARSAGVPCAAVCGSVGPGHERITDQMSAVAALEEIAGGVDAAMREPRRWLVDAGARIADAVTNRA